MADIQPRPVVATAAPHVSLIEAVAVDARRSALRHWRAVKMDLARLEREPATMRHLLAVARQVEVRAAERARETGKALDETLLLVDA